MFCESDAATFLKSGLPEGFSEGVRPEISSTSLRRRARAKSPNNSFSTRLSYSGRSSYVLLSSDVFANRLTTAPSWLAD